MSKYLTPADVAARLGIPTSTLHQWRWKGTGPPWIKVGRHLRVSEQAFGRWLAEREREAAGRGHAR